MAEFIDSWAIGQFENVRVESAAASFRKGFRFFADEVLAMDASEMDHHGEVIDNEPIRSFAVQRIHGPRYANELQHQPRDPGSIQISWTVSAAQ